MGIREVTLYVHMYAHTVKCKRVVGGVLGMLIG